jgi:hypothetical protein
MRKLACVLREEQAKGHLCKDRLVQTIHSWTYAAYFEHVIQSNKVQY